MDKPPRKTMTGRERRRLARALARAMLAGEAEVDATTGRVAETLGRDFGWAAALAKRVLAAYANEVRPRRAEVEAFLLRDRRFQWACTWFAGDLRIARLAVGTSVMQPLGNAADWGVPPIETEAALAEWLNLNPTELEWFADLKGLGGKHGSSEQLRHYHYRLVKKASGSVRLIEAPKGRMKLIQRQILREILNRVPVHGCAHGFVRERSIVTFAQPHAGQGVVLRMDLRNFFPAIRRARVQSIFRMLGYPERVADLLGGICTNAVPRRVLRGAVGEDQAELRRFYEQTHLPQGAPCSPMLANLCAYRLDCRLSGLARAAGAVYTRYADDLGFSGTGELERGVSRFQQAVRRIAEDEGFAVQAAKTRAMGRGQRQKLAGIVVNEKVNVGRDEIDRLKAILTNCARTGPTAQNRDGLPDFRAHLEGRVSFIAMVSPERGMKLKDLLGRIRWEG
jgi:hypothetical protein